MKIITDWFNCAVNDPSGLRFLIKRLGDSVHATYENSWDSKLVMDFNVQIKQGQTILFALVRIKKDH